jgi:7-cyano-7-deazaguanine synthase
MCAIIGAVVNQTDEIRINIANLTLNYIFASSVERGRDGRGWFLSQDPISPGSASWARHKKSVTRSMNWKETPFFEKDIRSGSLIANFRAEPTTEFIHTKTDNDQQPYISGAWAIVHNGTIANDKELRLNLDEPNRVPTEIDSAAIAELLAADHMSNRSWPEISKYFAEQISKLKGSYAILAMHVDHPGKLLLACNYRPIWYAASSAGVFFASSEEYFPSHLVPTMVEPYSMWAVDGAVMVRLDKQEQLNNKALVVCSGGMDSVVAATILKRLNWDVELIHFQYGSRAEGPEVEAVKAVAEALKVKVTFFPLPIYRPEDSPLLRHDSKIAGGEQGAEFAHEWVPARNLVMLAVATAVAEARGIENIVLGNNLEEAGAYPDNEPEFIKKFNKVLPFAVGDGKRVQVMMPVGNLMKHEIVAEGLKYNAPLDKTWSCYRSGPVHCGTCGPCYMRRTAFRINNAPEVISYANEE